jgi:uncharacterized damage-inducible protein DinB
MAQLYKRDLIRLRDQIEAFSNEADLWKHAAGMTNSAGNLVLHIEGNLREYVGRQMGGVDYKRERPLEFSLKGISRAELVGRIDALAEMLVAVLEKLTEAQLDAEYPEVMRGKVLTTRYFLLSLYGHMNWHMGQIDVIRRSLSDGDALTTAGI